MEQSCGPLSPRDVLAKQRQRVKEHRAKQHQGNKFLESCEKVESQGIGERPNSRHEDEMPLEIYHDVPVVPVLQPDQIAAQRVANELEKSKLFQQKVVENFPDFLQANEPLIQKASSSQLPPPFEHEKNATTSKISSGLVLSTLSPSALSVSELIHLAALPKPSFAQALLCAAITMALSPGLKHEKTTAIVDPLSTWPSTQRSLIRASDLLSRLNSFDSEAVPDWRLNLLKLSFSANDTFISSWSSVQGKSNLAGKALGRLYNWVVGVVGAPSLLFSENDNASSSSPKSSPTVNSDEDKDKDKDDEINLDEFFAPQKEETEEGIGVATEQAADRDKKNEKEDFRGRTRNRCHIYRMGDVSPQRRRTVSRDSIKKLVSSNHKNCIVISDKEVELDNPVLPPSTPPDPDNNSVNLFVSTRAVMLQQPSAPLSTSNTPPPLAVAVRKSPASSHIQNVAKDQLQPKTSFISSHIKNIATAPRSLETPAATITLATQRTTSLLTISPTTKPEQKISPENVQISPKISVRIKRPKKQTQQIKEKLRPPPVSTERRLQNTPPPPSLNLDALNLSNFDTAHIPTRSKLKSPSPPQLSPSSSQETTLFKLSNAASSSTNSTTRSSSCSGDSLEDLDCSGSSGSGDDDSDNDNNNDNGEFFISCRGLDKLMKVVTPREHEVIPSHMLIQKWMMGEDYYPTFSRNAGSFKTLSVNNSPPPNNRSRRKSLGGRKKAKEKTKPKPSSNPPATKPPIM